MKKRFYVYILSLICSTMAFSQKDMRAGYSDMFKQFRTLQNNLSMYDGWKYIVENVYDIPFWKTIRNGEYRTWLTEDVFHIEKTDSDRNGNIYFYKLFDAFDICPDSVSLHGEVMLQSDSAIFVVNINRKEIMCRKEIYAVNNTAWTKFNVTIPYKEGLNYTGIDFYIHGMNSGDRVCLRNFGIDADGVNIDDYIGKRASNDDHEFDVSSMFRFDNTTLTKEQTERLETICLVWGFAKYYNERIRQGERDWNYDLFRILNKAYNQKDKAAFNRALAECIPSFKTRKKDKYLSPNNNDSIISQISFDWMERQRLGRRLYNRLRSMRDEQHGDAMMTVGYQNSNEEIIQERVAMFKNESAYDNINPNDDGYRMLTLFRFWNMMYYFHPYIGHFEKKWRELLPEYIRVFAKARDRKDFEIACAGLISAVKDSHTLIYGLETNIDGELMWKYNNYLPVEAVMSDSCRILITRINAENYPKDGILPGDYIIGVNGKSIYDIRKDADKYNHYANLSADQYAPTYISFPGKSVTYTVERDGERKDVYINDFMSYWEKYKARESSTPATDTFENGIIYINLAAINTDSLTKVLNNNIESKAIIFDMRGYPVDYPAILDTLTGFLYPESKSIMRRSYADLNTPGTFRLNNCYTKKYGKTNPNYYKGKVAVLVNGTTISAAEIVALAIKNAPKATVIGEPTAGALARITFQPLLGGASTRITGAGVYLNDGRCTYPDGIPLDFVVHQMPEDIKADKDTQLEFAKTLLAK